MSLHDVCWLISLEKSACKSIFYREPICIFKSYLKYVYIEISKSLGSLQKFEGATVEFKGALGTVLHYWKSIGLSRMSTLKIYDFHPVLKTVC